MDWLFIAACKDYQTNYEYRSATGEYYGILSYVIAKDENPFDECRYVDLLESWGRSVSEKTRSPFPQDVDHEGRPGRKDPYMF